MQVVVEKRNPTKPLYLHRRVPRRELLGFILQPQPTEPQPTKIKLRLYSDVFLTGIQHRRVSVPVINHHALNRRWVIQ